MGQDEMPEAVELERAAEWRLRLTDADPADIASAKAAAVLQRLADQLRATSDLPLLQEYRYLCNWIGEAGELSDLADLIRDYHATIGAGEQVQSADAYLRTLIALASKVAGTN